MKETSYLKLRTKLEEVEADFHRSQEIKNDPLFQVLRYSTPEDQEVAAFIAAVFAYGNVKQVNKSLEIIFALLGDKPAAKLEGSDGFYWKTHIPKQFKHRFNDAEDLGCLLTWLGETLRRYQSLENLFTMVSVGFENEADIGRALELFIEKIITLPHPPFTSHEGALFFFSKPSGKSACKRLMLFLRWVAGLGPMDLNLWKNTPRAKLLIPVDTHVLRISKHLGLTRRNDNSWRTAQEITNALKNLDKENPTRFDFALCHLGISKECPSRFHETICGRCRMNSVCLTHLKAVKKAKKHRA